MNSRRRCRAPARTVPLKVDVAWHLRQFAIILVTVLIFVFATCFVISSGEHTTEVPVLPSNPPGDDGRPSHSTQPPPADQAKSPLRDAQYTYSPLLYGEEIRVLELERGNHEDELVGRLIHATDLMALDCQPISYTWGADLATARVYIEAPDGSSLGYINITSNAGSCLRINRLTDGSKCFWMDAVCIDQHNITEKSFQIPKMHTIYAMDTQPLIWLGEPLPGTADALLDLQCLAHFSGSICRAAAQDFRQGKGHFKASCGRQIDFRGLMKFFQFNAWFSRVWIVQEAAISRDAIVQYGNTSIPWSTLVDAVSNIKRCGLTAFNTPEIQRAFETIELIEQLSGHNALLSMSWFELLCRSISLEATDLRDKIYAFANLANDQILPGFTIDYARSLNKTLLDFFSWHSRNNLLHLLSLVSNPDSRPHDSSFLPELQWTEHRTIPLAQFSHTAGFTASNISRHESRIRLGEDNGKPIMSAVGNRLGQIIHLSDIASVVPLVTYDEPGIDNLNRARNMSNWLHQCKDMALSARGEPPALLEAVLAETLFCGMSDGGYPISDDFIEAFPEYLKFAAASVSEPGLPAPPGYSELFAKMEKSLHTCALNRRFAITGTGLFAMVPKWTKEGDVVTVLWRSTLPIVLRLPSGTYGSVIGDAYVYGMMHGDGVDPHSSEEFVLS